MGRGGENFRKFGPVLRLVAPGGGLGERGDEPAMRSRMPLGETTADHQHLLDVARLQGNKKVLFGATVSLVDEADGKASRYRIVGEYEADMKQGLISISSPLARALIGKVEGDVASFLVPGGEKN